ncbi:hypothetical protein F5B21DRAFT_506814 [Xylaria acuta]|nr:hypothetical protein F5B21DRAFT_506814 [Xylaria acuta]
MPSGERNNTESSGLNYGAAVGGENVDFAQDSQTESPGIRDRALLDKLKDALKPGDTKRASAEVEARRPSGDKTHDGRHGGIEEVMQQGNRDYYDETEDVARGGLLDELGQRTPPSESGRRSGILDSVKFGHGQSRGEEPKETKSGGGGGGLMDAVRRKSDSGSNDKYRNSSHVKSSDEKHLPGAMAQSIRDDFLK